MMNLTFAGSIETAPLYLVNDAELHEQMKQVQGALGYFSTSSEPGFDTSLQVDAITPDCEFVADAELPEELEKFMKDDFYHTPYITAWAALQEGGRRYVVIAMERVLYWNEYGYSEEDFESYEAFQEAEYSREDEYWSLHIKMQMAEVTAFVRLMAPYVWGAGEAFRG